jgi:hypothetical protein
VWRRRREGGGSIADEMRTLRLVLGVEVCYAMDGFSYALDDLGGVRQPG